MRKKKGDWYRIRIVCHLLSLERNPCGACIVLYKGFIFFLKFIFEQK